jgi:hypothetical protein
MKAHKHLTTRTLRASRTVEPQEEPEPFDEFTGPYGPERGREWMRESTETARPQTTTSGATQDSTGTVTTIRNAALQRLENSIEFLARPNATIEDFLTAMDTEAGLKAIVREYSARLKDAAIEYVNNNGPVETETARYYVGTKRTTKCRDTTRAVEAVLQATGGDLDRLVGCLSSQPLKHGECEGVLGDEWDRHFAITEVPDLKTGRPQKELKRGLPRGKDVE